MSEPIRIPVENHDPCNDPGVTGDPVIFITPDLARRVVALGGGSSLEQRIDTIVDGQTDLNVGYDQRIAELESLIAKHQHTMQTEHGERYTGEPRMYGTKIDGNHYDKFSYDAHGHTRRTTSPDGSLKPEALRIAADGSVVDAPSQPKSGDDDAAVGSMSYRGNTVSFIYDKMQARGAAIDRLRAERDKACERAELEIRIGIGMMAERDKALADLAVERNRCDVGLVTIRELKADLAACRAELAKEKERAEKAEAILDEIHPSKGVLDAVRRERDALFESRAETRKQRDAATARVVELERERAALTAQRDELAALLRETAEILALCDQGRAGRIRSHIDEQADSLGRANGYGAWMDALQRAWQLRDDNTCHTVGPCLGTVRHAIKDINAALARIAKPEAGKGDAP